MNEILKHDLYRFNGCQGWGNFVKTFLTKWEFQHVVLLRWYQSSKVKLFSRLLLRWSCLRTGIQIGYHTKIGKGLLIVHYGDIAVKGEKIKNIKRFSIPVEQITNPEKFGWYRI